MAEPATAGSAGGAPSGSGGGVAIGVPKEIVPGERRVSLIPETAGRFVKQGARVLVETGAGEGAFFLDDAYRAVGAEVVPDARTLYERSDLVLKIHRPQSGEDGTADEVALLRPGSALIAFLSPMFNPELAQALAAKNVTSFSMDAIPRTTRAQYMDALSAMSTVAGYKAALLAADHLAKFFPLLMTAAGTIAPAKVLIIGAGVAGLQAIGTARRLGAVVEAYDARPVVKEQVESLGAKFVEIDIGAGDTQTAGGYAREMTADEIRRQQEGLAAKAAQMDAVITTALIPGRPAPLLITEDAVKRMRPGSVVVDLAGETGGNCALSVPGETVVREHVTILAPLNLPATIPVHASQMYAKVLQNLLALMLSKDGRFQPDWNDDIVAATVITRDGEVVHEGTRKRLGLAPLTPPEPVPEPVPPVTPVEEPVAAGAVAAVATGAMVAAEPVVADEPESTPADWVADPSPGDVTDETATDIARPWFGSSADALPDLPESASEPETETEPIPMPAPAAEAGPDDALAFMNEDEALNPLDEESPAPPESPEDEPGSWRSPQRE